MSGHAYYVLTGDDPYVMESWEYVVDEDGRLVTDFERAKAIVSKSGKTALAHMNPENGRLRIDWQGNHREPCFFHVEYDAGKCPICIADRKASKLTGEPVGFGHYWLGWKR